MDKYTQVSFDKVDIADDFWRHRQLINVRNSIYTVQKRFAETGRFEAFKCSWKPGMPNKPHYFYDSDVAKWIEAVAYILRKEENPELEAAVDEVVGDIEANQGEDGYFNVYFTVVDPDNRWQNRDWHELYCAGHLIEAAVAYYQATGKEKFLKLMCKYADYIEKVFKKEQSANFYTCGHEEIELALVKLYHCTDEKRYLELSRYFIDTRGTKEKDNAIYTSVKPEYGQSHLPVREQTTAEGHAVRAVYLYSAMADLAYEYGDAALKKACRTLFENIAFKRMYVTGGIGSTSRGEAFTIDYDLPNLTAYSESCAAIGLVFFASRMLKLDPDGLYGNVAERALYNGCLSSVSLDGNSFFYENPLEIDPKLRHRENFAKESTRMPATRRAEVFSCSCCPPNINRFIASVGNLLYTNNCDTVFVHQYMTSKTDIDMNGQCATIMQKSNYPNDGVVDITVSGFKGKKLAVRIPDWCRNYSIEMDGRTAKYSISKGYAYLEGIQDKSGITLSFEMKVQLIEANPAVQDDAGRVAVQRGPIVYCLEEIDNGPNLRDIAIDTALDVTVEYSDYYGANIIKALGYRRDPNAFEGLYRIYEDQDIKQHLTFIPYYAFANREETEMIVWINKK